MILIYLLHNLLSLCYNIYMTQNINKEYKELEIGDNAPPFELIDQNNKIHTLKQYKGKKVLIYFYPKDDTPGCTTEACNFRDNMKELEKRNIIILGVSKDNIKSHNKFSEKYNLNFPILSDESLEMIKSYNAWAPKKFMGREFLGIIRKSILIDEKGKIKRIYNTVKPATHTQDIIDEND